MAASTTVKISRQDLQALKMPPEGAFITDIRDLASYNWVESPEPTIAVPGSPDLWSPPKGPCKVDKDSGHIYIAQNAARHPDSPLEPLFRAVYVAHPSFDMRSVDLITDRNNIRKLLSVINPKSARNGLENFTINVEVAGNTIILARDEAKVEEFIGPGEFKGFGHEFEKRYTKTRLSGSTGHHRIISYRFSNMNFIVRHETDGFVDPDSNKAAPADLQDWAKDLLSDKLASMSLSGSDKKSPRPPPVAGDGDGSKLRIKKEGSVVPRESTLEIKTRVATKPISFNEVATQLWVSQTPKLVRAYHNRGLFREPVVEEVAEHIKSWERTSQKDLRRLAALITEILRVAREIGGRMRIKYDVITDALVIQECDGKKMLPDDLYSLWEEKAEAGLEEEKAGLEVEDAGIGTESSEETGDAVEGTKLAPA